MHTDLQAVVQCVSFMWICLMCSMNTCGPRIESKRSLQEINICRPIIDFLIVLLFFTDKAQLSEGH